MKKLIVSILFLSFTFLLKAQTPEVVKDVSWKFSDLKMEINYDLLSPDGKNRTYDIQLKINLNGQIITPDKGIIGINQQPAGNRKTIEWYFTRSGFSEEELNVNGLQVSIEASNPIPPIEIPKEESPVVEEPTTQPTTTTTTPSTTVSKPKPPSLILPAATAGVGLGVAVLGFVTEGEAKDLYDVYKAHQVESAQRETDYQAANDKHKTAQYLQIGGGVLVGVGAYLLYRTTQKRNSPQFSVVPTLDDAPLYGVYSGVGIQYRF